MNCNPIGPSSDVLGRQNILERVAFAIKAHRRFHERFSHRSPMELPILS